MNDLDLPTTATLTVPEAALLLGVSRTSAYAAVKRGDIETIKIGRRRLVKTATLLTLLGVDQGRA